MVPTLDYLDASGVCWHQEYADTRLLLVSASPNGEPTQQRNAGRVELVTGDQPSAGLEHAHSGGQTAARRRTEFGLDAQMVYECAFCDRVARDSLDQMMRPTRAQREERVRDVLHGQDERSGGV